MRVYAVRILGTVFADIDEIAEFIVSVSSPEHAVRYVDELQAEILSLRYLAGIIPESRYQTVRQYHPCAKQLRTRNRKLNIIFHTEVNLAIVDKILPSKMIIN